MATKLLFTERSKPWASLETIGVMSDGVYSGTFCIYDENVESDIVPPMIHVMAPRSVRNYADAEKVLWELFDGLLSKINASIKDS